ncbi:hypothetical protein [Nocardia sp. R6R-6]|uniref:hypothetical protein n=1 Tax=Nocardia sp. R6R-6 TaxID=3459303 RepID=UPI00403DBF90
MKADHPPGFAIDDITLGHPGTEHGFTMSDTDAFDPSALQRRLHAQGFGATADGHAFALRTVRAMLTLEIYRRAFDSAVPGPEDVCAVADATATDIDHERSVIALVRDLVPAAAPIDAAGRDATSVRVLR